MKERETSFSALDRFSEKMLFWEALARHKGSVFGALGEEAQPSSEQMRHTPLPKLDLSHFFLGLDHFSGNSQKVGF